MCGDSSSRGDPAAESEEIGRKGGAIPALAEIAAPAPLDPVRETLRRVWGFDDFRPGQERVIRRALAGESTLLVMPTGFGKSLCYQLPALRFDGTTLVLSPLIALMQDQLDGLPLAARAVSTQLNQNLEPAEMEARLRGIARGLYRLVYAAPERLRQQTFLHALRAAGVSLLVVDEAHCISTWGHDFRPDYQAIGAALPVLGDPPVLAMTATATPDLQEEIRGELRRDMARVNLGSYRPNLFLTVTKARTTAEKQQRLLAACREPGATLIYTRTRQRTEQLAEFLVSMGLPARFYHAGMLAAEREAAQNAFISGECPVMAATIAFGMGIDKPDIRRVIHYEPPDSLDAYHQEIGRAGRDGLPAHCDLWYTPEDLAWGVRRSAEHALPVAEVLAVREAIETLQSWGEPLIAWDDLARETELADQTVRTALGLLERVGGLRRGADVPRTMTLYVRDAGADAGFAAFVERARLRERQRIAIETRELCERAELAPEALEAAILAWTARGWIDYRPSARALTLDLLADTAGPSLEERLQLLIRRIGEASTRRGEALLAFLDSDACRHQALSRYFGHDLDGPCDHCDRCARRWRLWPLAAAPARELPDGTAPSPTEELPAPPIPLVDEAASERAVLACLEELPFRPTRGDLIRLLLGDPEAPVLGDRARQFGALRRLGVAGVAARLEAVMRGGLVRERWSVPAGPRLQLTRAGQRALAGAPREAAVELPADLLYEQLCAWRKARASAERRLPYFVLSNAALRAIARERPASVPRLMALPGVGVERGRAYGPEILPIVNGER
jgi:ATP-dependent DNA helicase RecQ